MANLYTCVALCVVIYAIPSAIAGTKPGPHRETKFTAPNKFHIRLGQTGRRGRPDGPDLTEFDSMSITFRTPGSVKRIVQLLEGTKEINVEINDDGHLVFGVETVFQGGFQKTETSHYLSDNKAHTIWIHRKDTSRNVELVVAIDQDFQALTLQVPRDAYPSFPSTRGKYLYIGGDDFDGCIYELEFNEEFYPLNLLDQDDMSYYYIKSGGIEKGPCDHQPYKTTPRYTGAAQGLHMSAPTVCLATLLGYLTSTLYR